MKGGRRSKRIGLALAGLMLLVWPGHVLAGGLETAREGLAAQKRGAHAEAVVKFTRAIKSGRLGRLNLALAHVNRANSFRRLGEVAAAIKDLETGIELAPDHPAGYNSLAWLLATSPQARHRDGSRAVELAGKALKLGGKTWRSVHLDTRAAALAEAGRMAEARTVQKEALELMKKDGSPTEIVAGARERLESYNQEKAWQEKAGP